MKSADALGEQRSRRGVRYSCVLLSTARDYLAEAAETYAKTMFEVLHFSRYVRQARVLDEGACEALERGKVDFLFSFLCPVIIREKWLQAARVASINFHPAPPRYPGVGSASFAIYNEDAHFGVTAHVMEKQPDAGAILRTLEFPIAEADTCETLFERAENYSLLLFYEVLAELAGSGKVAPSGRQWERKAITRKEFEKWMTVSVDDSPEEIERKVRAVRHSRLAGPFVEIAGRRFELSE